MPRQQQNDPEAQQPLQAVPRPQYGSSSVNNGSSCSSPMQKTPKHSSGFHFAHFALFLPTVFYCISSPHCFYSILAAWAMSQIMHIIVVMAGTFSFGVGVGSPS